MHPADPRTTHHDTQGPMDAAGIRCSGCGRPATLYCLQCDVERCTDCIGASHQTGPASLHDFMRVTLWRALRLRIKLHRPHPEEEAVDVEGEVRAPCVARSDSSDGKRTVASVPHPSGACQGARPVRPIKERRGSHLSAPLRKAIEALRSKFRH